MNETWAAMLALAVATMALVQVSMLVGVIVFGRRALASLAAVERRVETLALEVHGALDSTTTRVTAVADEVRAVAHRAQQVTASVADGVKRVEAQVRAAGHHVQATVNQVPPGVRKAVPAGLAILAAVRTAQRVGRHLNARRSPHKQYRAS